MTTTPTDRAAFEAERQALVAYLKDCDDFAIVPDVGGAWHAAWQAATAAERERAAKVCESFDPGCSYRLRERLAAAIRSAPS